MYSGQWKQKHQSSSIIEIQIITFSKTKAPTVLMHEKHNTKLSMTKYETTECTYIDINFKQKNHNKCKGQKHENASETKAISGFQEIHDSVNP